MLLRRPLSALLRPLLAASGPASASDAAPLRLSAASAGRSGLVSLRPAPFCTSEGNIAPASSALACPDPLEVLRLRLEKERGICIDRLVPGLEHRGACPEAFGESKSPITSNIVKELKINSTLKRHPMRIAQLMKPPKLITEESLQLQPLCPELIDYFSSRMISPETLWRNGVRQKMSRNEVLIAFTYKRNKKLVGCKYRGPGKYFFQVAGCERIFYGLDDIERASEIIIVEGEMDKLAMEEAGYRNCVSVPHGASAKVSKVVPSEEEDTKFKFLHNCKEYLAKASRIVLATDSDPPGQSLAEELARRLGKERCWRVKWPSSCKDANEVLMFEDRDTLKELIVNAEMYPVMVLPKFSAFFKEIDDYYNHK